MPWAHAVQVARPAMSVLRKANQPNIPPRCQTTTSRMSVSAGKTRQGRLTAEPLQRQEGCEEEGFIPERFGMSFRVAVVATHLLEPSCDRHFCSTESVETLPRVI